MILGRRVGGAAPVRIRALVSALVCVALLAAAASPMAAAAPPAAKAPDAGFVVNNTIGKKLVPVRVKWPKAVPGGAGIASYRLERRVDEGAWQAVSLATALTRAVTVKLRPGTLNQFRVQATDSAGLTSGWATGKPRWLALIQDGDLDIEWTGSWIEKAVTSAHGGRLHYSGEPAATAVYTFKATWVAWVAPRGPKKGRAHVSINGNSPTTVDLTRATNQPRRIVFARSWTRAYERTMGIAVEGTADRPRVDVDALLTLGPPPTSVLVGAGDIATCARTNDEATADVVESIRGTAFTTGDNVYPAGTADEFANCYEPSWGRFKSRTRPSTGNHDYQSSASAAPYFVYFGARAGTPGQGWYAYDSGTWRVYALNSNCANVGGCGTASAQYAWLQSDLAENPRRCVAAYWHHPRFSSGYHGGSTRMRDIFTLLHDNDADLVLAGHDHSYERFAPMTSSGVLDPERGIRSFVVGTGGGYLYAPGTVAAPNSEIHRTDTYGVLKLKLSWSGYEWDFVPAGRGTFTDSGSGACH